MNFIEKLVQYGQGVYESQLKLLVINMKLNFVKQIRSVKTIGFHLPTNNKFMGSHGSCLNEAINYQTDLVFFFFFAAIAQTQLFLDVC